MVDYVAAGNEMWIAPGHNGGMFYRRSPIGRVFFDFLGENFFRSDFNFVPDLGGIFDHSGAFLKAEQDAAKIFNAERTYFVLNGTSTSNKMVNGAAITQGDLVLFDRNNHKSHHHSALMTNGGIPIYLPADRNAYGMVGPIDYYSLDEDKLRQQIKNNPLVKDKNAWKKERPFRAVILENCTYDGTIYNVETIINKLGHLCDYLFFDEAWGGFMRFHPLFKGRYAMGLEKLKQDDPGIFVTQSTHKQLAGMSQASQVHIRDSHLQGQKRRINHKRFNEVYMMHMSTSPFYPMFASLDVGAQMMKGKNGEFLWDEAIRRTITLRKQVRALSKEYNQTRNKPEEQWFFDPFVPDKVTIKNSAHTPDLQDMPWEEIADDVLCQEQQCWTFAEGANWHGYTKIKGDYAMVDPTKFILLTPGIDRQTGEYMDWGVPGPILGAFMRSRGIVPEKTDFNLILFLITPALERCKEATLLAELVEFKKLFDSNALIDDILPDLVKEFPSVYKGRGLKDICLEMHNCFRSHRASLLQQQQFESEHFPEMAMSPQEAFNELMRNNVDYVPLSQAKGRIAASLALVYPPGIGVMIPGERYDHRAKPQLDYLKMFEDTNTRFPGFENEIQGAYAEEQNEGETKYFTYVVKEDNE
ncbi:aminotransferase class I/II-fold pyridoxal phosphate-dependent enzyme [Piscirickettsia litoralis]|uniref:aminotransferase class I/II-fold pyridoxal phosphate-dependent enzyme n=1 Tax=Piscirickettsia litoralis TaxID=1891921 RepID=UPI001112F34A|nr:aminotransferase class I/II-fold pyridoxal phosphate-dependent enzyme [Piscirickettsia litoralis]